MKILLLAYACEPNRGSEPGIGWNWAINLAADRFKDVYVVTRSNNKSAIDNYWKSKTELENLHFFYYDLPPFFIWLKHHGMPDNMYYAFWLQKCITIIKLLHQKYCFDLAHHITFGVFRNACSLYKLNIPYILGPFGGGEYTPSSMLVLFSYKENLIEKIRYLINKISLLDIRLRKSFNKSLLILTKTKETKEILHKWREKTVVNLEIGINEICISEQKRNKEIFIFVGRFIYWKGIKLTLKVFKEYQSFHPSAKLFFIGKGNMEYYIKKFSQTNNLENNIKIINWIGQDNLKKYYSQSCAMLFPSLHDSSGNVVLEALSHGLPVLCLDCGGPSSILGENLKETIETTKNKSIDDIINGLKNKMEFLASNSLKYNEISNKCIIRAQSMLWENTISNTYKLINKRIFNK